MAKEGILYRLDAPIWKELGLTPPVPEVRVGGKLYCSFCQAEVDRTRATYGIIKPQMRAHIREVPKDKNDKPITYYDKIGVGNGKVIACPNCCLKVKPLYSKHRPCKGVGCFDCKFTGEGDMISQGTKFPE